MHATLDSALKDGDLVAAAALWRSDAPPRAYEAATTAFASELSGAARGEHLDALRPILLAEPAPGDPRAFAPALLVELMRLRRLEPPLFAKMRNDLAPRVADQESDAATLVALGLECVAEGRHDAVIRHYALNSTFARFCMIFDTRLARNRNTLLTWLRGADFPALSPETQHTLIRFATTIDNDLADALLASIGDTEASLTTPQGVLARAAHLRRAPRPPALKTAPRIAVCVSGQLRGYEACRPTWGLLGFDEPLVDTFVHVWRKIGHKYPIGGHADRCFSGAFLEAYRSAFRTLGRSGLESAYPSLFAWFRSEADADAAKLRALYRTEQVVIEDDDAPDVARFSNPDRMYYKAERAYDLMRASGRAYDLIVRIRPDKPVRDVKNLDWREIYAELSTKRAIFADQGPFLHTTARNGIGDHFAVGDAETMAAYSTAETQTRRAAHDGAPYGFPVMCHPHENFAAACFTAGVRVEAVPNVTFGPLQETGTISRQELATRVRADIGASPRSATDQMFLDALARDLA